MALIRCPECAHAHSDRAFVCPGCGRPAGAASLFGSEYRSAATLFGLPLVHIATGLDPLTGRRRLAKGVIAIGDLAVGLVAIGGGAFGVLAIGGGAVGLLALGGGVVGLLLAVGGCAVGGIALGGMAVGLVAVGGGAVGYYAMGGGVWGVHGYGGNQYDPEALDFFWNWFGSWFD